MFEISDMIRYIVLIKSPLPDEPHPVKNFFMIDNVFIRAYAAIYSDEEILCLLLLLYFLSEILDSICKYVLFIFLQAVPRLLNKLYLVS